MENIYNIRKKENLNFILPTNTRFKHIEDKVLNDTCIIVNLYYFESLEWYVDYLNDISESVVIYIFSSRKEVLEKCKFLLKRSNTYFKKKENRGRDISTLLVAARNIILQYKYICFIHDKSANADYLKEDIEFWKINLWGNTLASNGFIENVLELFDNNPEFGLFVPPEPYGEYNSHWYGNTWRENFKSTKKIVEKLQLKVNVSSEKEVFTLSTVFWAKTSALKKLFDYPWQYEDFPKEPLPIDGTISHAIERVIGYVAQDAGYKTATLMTEEYASKLLLRVQDDMRRMFYQLEKREYVFNMYQIKNLDQRERQIAEFFDTYSNIYIYGAGNYGKNIYHFLKKRKMIPKGFVVSTDQRKQSIIEELPVYEIQEIENSDDTGILIAVSYEYQEKIENILNKYRFKHFIYGY